MSPVKDERTYLLHAIEAIEAILSYTRDGNAIRAAGRRLHSGTTYRALSGACHETELIAHDKSHQDRDCAPRAPFQALPFRQV